MGSTIYTWDTFEWHLCNSVMEPKTKIRGQWFNSRLSQSACWCVPWLNTEPQTASDASNHMIFKKVKHLIINFLQLKLFTQSWCFREIMLKMVSSAVTSYLKTWCISKVVIQHDSNFYPSVSILLLKYPVLLILLHILHCKNVAFNFNLNNKHMKMARF